MSVRFLGKMKFSLLREQLSLYQVPASLTFCGIKSSFCPEIIRVVTCYLNAEMKTLFSRRVGDHSQENPVCTDMRGNHGAGHYHR